MNRQNQNTRPKPKCYECEKELTGTIGVHFHRITSSGRTHYYCMECIEKMKGAGK